MKPQTWGHSSILLPVGFLTNLRSHRFTENDHTVDGSEILRHLGCTKPCKQWDQLPTSTGEFTGFLPSIVFLATEVNTTKVWVPALQPKHANTFQ